jgi:peptidoglycan/LPS O-acetylase OafA/YrhL
VDQPLGLVGSIRGIAMLGVFAMHATLFLELSGHRVAGRDYFVEAGRVSVAVFFVLAGFLLYLPFAIARLSGSAPPALGPYYLRRGARIIPAYWFVLFVCAVVFGWTYVFTPGGFVTYFGFLQIFSNDTLARGLFPAWAIDVLVLFYVVLPGWSWLMRRIPISTPPSLQAFGRTEGGMLLALGLAGVAWKIWGYGVTRNTNGGYRPAEALVLALPAYLDVFAIGMGLAVVYLLAMARGEERPAVARAIERRPTLPWVAAALLFLLIVAIDPWINRGRLSDSDDPALIVAHVLSGVFAVALLLPTVFGTAKRGLATRFLALPALVAFGTVSYGFFLWHGTVLQEVHPKLQTLGPRGYVLVALAVSLAAGAVSYVVIERPALRLARRLPRRGAAEPATPVPRLRRLPVLAPAFLAVGRGRVRRRPAAGRRLAGGARARGWRACPAGWRSYGPEGSATVTPGAVSGAVRQVTACGGALVVRGWAAGRGGRPAERIVALRGRRLVAAGAPDRRVMDVAPGAAGGLRRSGFVIAGPAGGARPAPPGDGLRVFAVAGDRASRLPVRAGRAGDRRRPGPAPDGRRPARCAASWTTWWPGGRLSRSRAGRPTPSIAACPTASWSSPAAGSSRPVPRWSSAPTSRSSTAPPSSTPASSSACRWQQARARQLASGRRVRVFAVLGRRASELPVATPR